MDKLLGGGTKGTVDVVKCRGVRIPNPLQSKNVSEGGFTHTPLSGGAGTGDEGKVSIRSHGQVTTSTSSSSEELGKVESADV